MKREVVPSDFAQFVKDHWDEVLSGHFVEQVNEAFKKLWFSGCNADSGEVAE